MRNILSGPFAKVTVMVICSAFLVGQFLSFALPTYAATHLTHTHLVPLYGCYGATCEGLKPPPITNCGGGNIIHDSEPMIATDGTTQGYLELHISYWTRCLSAWANVWAGAEITVDALGIWETYSDGSNQGEIDPTPHLMFYGNNESSYMVGQVSRACYNAAVSWTDASNNVHGIMKTVYYCSP